MSEESVTVLACPYCDSAGVRHASNDVYRCEVCNETFEDPVERDRRGSPGLRGDSLASVLDEADPDDLRTDGGESDTAESIGHIHRLPVDGDEDRVVLVNGELAKRRDGGMDHIELDAEDTNGDDIVVTLGFDGGGLGVSVRWLDNELLADPDHVDDEQPGHTFRDTTLGLVGEIRVVKMGDVDV